MVVAKNDNTHHALSKLFAAHDLTRIYKVLVWGGPKMKTGTVEGPIDRHPVDRKRMAMRRSGGRHSITEWWLEERFGNALTPIASLMGARLHTGRTHQVRVHMSHLGLPVVGDPLYGRKRQRPRTRSVEIIQTAGASCGRPGVYPPPDQAGDALRHRIASRLPEADH